MIITRKDGYDRSADEFFSDCCYDEFFTNSRLINTTVRYLRAIERHKEQVHIICEADNYGQYFEVRSEHSVYRIYFYISDVGDIVLSDIRRI